ncbi:hypothetical protein AC578_4319 [Pseudocercospora eumusae]|uniref:Uncharacterized protein n=1 Tax=Pseudocercospora eumusae TaxID=321146 RepID=A0A139H833_9PEZI|nr:hypothetical protein AC578_4319 [Pseudocercospora eumusae]
MSSRAVIASLVAIATLATAQNATLMKGPGPYPSGEASRFSNASAQASKTVQFALWYPSQTNDPAPTWSWETRIEEGTVEDSDVPNAVQLNTVFSFSWGDGSLASAAAQHIGQLDPQNFCVTVVDSLFPARTTNAYDTDTEDHASDGSCSKPLRGRCLDAINDAFAKADPDENGCRGGNLDLSSIHQCEWSFEHHYSASTYNLLRNSTANQAANDTFPLRSGEGFAHITSDTYDSSNQTLVTQQEGKLQMIIIDSGNVRQPLCMRVNTDRDARGYSTGALGNSGNNAGINFWLIGAAGIAALAYML